MLIFLNEGLTDCEIYDTFDLALLCDNECRNLFRFYKNYTSKLKQVLRVPHILYIVTDK